MGNSTSATPILADSAPSDAPPAPRRHRDPRRRNWRPDEERDDCERCQTKFTFLTRRHHCRCCSGLFCNTCSSFRAPCPDQGYADDVRVCRDCYAAATRNAARFPPEAPSHRRQPQTLRSFGLQLGRDASTLEDMLGADTARVLRQLPPELRGAIFLAMLEQSLMLQQQPPGATAAAMSLGASHDQIATHLSPLTPSDGATGGVNRSFAAAAADFCDSDEADNCAICQEPLIAAAGYSDDSTSPSVVELPCRHVFHKSCVVNWLQRKNECPLCKCALPP